MCFLGMSQPTVKLRPNGAIHIVLLLLITDCRADTRRKYVVYRRFGPRIIHEK